MNDLPSWKPAHLESMTSALMNIDPDAPDAALDALQALQGHVGVRSSEGRGNLNPIGLPECVPISRLLDVLSHKTPLYQTLKKTDRRAKKTRRNKDDLAESAFLVPAPKAQKEKLTQRQLLILPLVATHSARIGLLADLIEKGQADAAPEVVLINRYYKAICGRELINCHGICQDDPADWLEALESDQNHPMERLAGNIACRPPNPLVRDILDPIIVRGLIARSYADIAKRGEHASKAAAFIFAVASLAESRWFFDYVYQESPSLFETHFRSLVFDNQHLWLKERLLPSTVVTAETQPDSEAGSKQRLPWYEPVNIDLTGVEFRYWVNLGSSGAMLEAISNDLFDVADTLIVRPTSWQSRQSLFGVMPQTAQQLRKLNEVFNGTCERIQEITETLAPLQVRSVCEKLVQAYQDVMAAFPELETEAVPVMPNLIECFKEYLDNLAAVANATVEDELPPQLPADQVPDIEDLLNQSDQLIEKRGELQTQVDKLAKDPIRNQKAMQSVFAELAELNVMALLDQITANARELEQRLRGHTEANRPESVAALQAASAEDESAVREGALRSELAEARQQVQKLSAEMVQIASQKEALEFRLAEKAERLDGTMTEEIRALVSKAFQESNQLRTEECLTLLKAVHPHAVILPSAWSSAVESVEFEATDRLWDLLQTLAGSYFRDLQSGVPDSEARKRFPSNTYAANESDTTLGNKRAMREREFLYQGEMRPFLRHLKIGVADNVRTTLRVHFDVIDGNLVIAHCGPHKRL